MPATETRSPVDRLPAPRATGRGGLDEAARRGLRRDIRRGGLLVLLGIVMVLPLLVLLHRQDRFQHTGLGTRGTVLETHRGVFDSVTVSYWWHGVHHASVVHVDNADGYCPQDGSRLQELVCSSHPRVILDRHDPGHATLPRELNFSPATQVVYATTALLLSCFVPLWPVVAGFSLVKESRRRRRLLEVHPWQEYAFQVRGSRERAQRRGGLYEVSNGDGSWRSLRLVNTSSRRASSLLKEEALEIAGDQDGGSVVARARGSSVLGTAQLAGPGRSAVGSVTHGAGLGEPSAVDDESSASMATLLLSGLRGDFDILGPHGESLGEITRRGKRYEVRDREGRLALLVRKRGRRHIALDSRGCEMVSLVDRARRMSFEFPVGTRGVGRSWATSAVALHPSTSRWALANLTGGDLARVTRIEARYLIQIGEGDGVVGSPLVTQALLVALANPPPN